jgi:hypothetical protein
LEKAGWVTPPPPPPHEGLLEKIGLAHPPPPPLAPKPAGILGHHHHDLTPPPTERLADKISALGISHKEPPKEEHGLAHKLSGAFQKEEKKDEGGVSGLVKKISGALRGEEKKEERVYMIFFFRREVLIDAS